MSYDMAGQMAGSWSTGTGGYPASRGKVLPTAVAADVPLPSADTEATATSMTTTTVQMTSWRLRDTAEQLLAARRQVVSVDAEAPSPLSSGHHHHHKTKKMHLSANMDPQTSLARIQRDKAVTVQVAFHAAGTAVLEALQSPEYTGNNSNNNNTNNDAVDPAAVPSSVEQWNQWQEMRIKSLERSHENKEYTKKKGAKVDVDLDQHEHQQNQDQQDQDQQHEQQHEKKKVTIKAEGDSTEPTTTTTTPTITKDKRSSSISSIKSDSSKKQGTASTATTSTTTTTSSGSKAAAVSSDGPKFTRNTPASSAAALDFRFNSSRAILCAAGNLAFEALTPPLSGHDVDVLCVPQNPSHKKGNALVTTAAAATTLPDATASTATTTTTTSSAAVNMGAVVVEAQTLAQRTISVAQNAVHRSAMRYQYRKDNARYDCDDKDFLHVPNPFAWKPKNAANNDSHGGGGGSTSSSGGNTTDEDDDQSDNAMDVEEKGVLASLQVRGAIPHRPNRNAITDTWKSLCLPRFLAVLRKGAGHAVYHDVQWSDRHGRIADLLRALTGANDSANGNGSDKEDNSNMGPHLIVTTQPDVTRFAQEFHDMSNHVRLVTTNESKSLNVMAYSGSKKRRRNLRRYFSKGTGLPEAPFHVIVTSYASFLEDYFHFCQLPFEVVVLDDGVSWMAAAQGDQNSAIGSIWDGAIWSKNDHQVGLAGTTFKQWDYSRDKLPEATIFKEAWIGLTARHRVMTSSTLRIQQRQSLDLVPVSGLVDFVAPHFSDVVREEWDRSKIASDSSSMEHFRQLMARSTVVHHPDSPETDTHTLALLALNGNLPSSHRFQDAAVPRVLSEDEFISKGMVAFSRRFCLMWLGPPEQSWLRYELGNTSVKHILDAMKVTNNHGAVCEEITTASSTTSSGATGQVAGTMAYRLAVRCGRHFGSEQGLRQHISALHAPPGTWLCRTCASDCVTSQARTHHERSCGQSSSGVSGDQGGSVGATPTVGQGGPAKAGVGKKKGKASQPPAPGEENDADGSFRVPGYRGVWVNTEGKHFVKVDGERLTAEDGKSGIIFFDNIDDAARKHDSILRMQKKKNHNQKMELNFRPDGSRFLYEDITPASTSGLGGSAANVVPALSVINIKDLPPDVKPLLRDPRQTSRTGGNSKRHVYAYRGVCRQARKGHDRWQSQISFMGVNHYLGTFDSEWDAAAIYAWAHLILYGEEATRQAQKEGEEAAAAYEQEKRDIASGKIPAPAAAAKPEKKKKKKEKKEQNDKAPSTPKNSEKRPAPEGVQSSGTAEKSTEKTKKRKSTGKSAPSTEKKPKSARKEAPKLETIAPVLAKGVTKAPILAPREAFEGIDDSELSRMASLKLVAARGAGYRASESQNSLSGVEGILRPCIPLTSSLDSVPVGGAMLVGLSPSHFGWDLEDFIAMCELKSEQDTMTAIQMLAVEYDEGGVNAKFHSVIQSTICIVGNASTSTQKLYKSLGLGSVPIGGSVGELDCHVGGMPGSCSEKAACIAYAPTTVSEFQFCCLSDDDMVTLNGKRITVEMGCFPLLNEDICTVGARVFAFLLP